MGSRLDKNSSSVQKLPQTKEHEMYNGEEAGEAKIGDRDIENGFEEKELREEG